MNAGGPRSARFGDLGLRVASGLVLAAIAFANVWAGGAWATAFLALALVLMLWEYHRMITGDGRPLAPALVALAADARAAHERALREEAARAAPKIQLAVALLLVPSALLLVGAALAATLAG